ncbi:UPF0052-domain-containing protein [Atractiella rhizophila]|nr:UPF0052-domain-containing protein [Atractiella rhizophila]
MTRSLNWVLVGGGTGANSVLDAFLRLSSSSDAGNLKGEGDREGGRIDFVLPISDNGGSSSEIIRVLGGPSLGDIRSRLVRLIPNTTISLRRIRGLLEYRLPATDDSRALKMEHHLWEGIEDEKKEVIRSFLVQFEHSILARAHKGFDFRNGSIGNFFLCAMQMFFRSIQSAIFLFTSITSIPDHIRVIPCIFSNSICTIAAELSDGSTILGQCEISHPSSKPLKHPPPPHPATISHFKPISRSFTPTIPNFFLGSGDDDPFGEERSQSPVHERGNANGTRTPGNVVFSKEEEEADGEEDRIERVFYINQFGQEIEPRPNGNFLTALSYSDALLYSCGSLFTSLLACLTLRGVGRTILEASKLKYKILLLNTTMDRETRGLEDAVDVLICVKRAMDDEVGNGEVKKVEIRDLSFGVKCVRLPWTGKGRPKFDDVNVEEGLRRLLAND